jgi:hypothetical protein
MSASHPYGVGMVDESIYQSTVIIRDTHDALTQAYKRSPLRGENQTMDVYFRRWIHCLSYEADAL